ncbi:LysR family transcriptional regulator [Ottowia sp. VDI28]|uniref:LysR family transcriptional regulator n=1 Tax=Ottowia sp. VDI28 TaxID=3133968 RepID=UPI003C308D59
MDVSNLPDAEDEERLRRLVLRLRFRHLQLLAALRKAGSLHAAAEVLHLTQPSLSKMLHEVEQAFGQQLFERGARGLKPTRSGDLAMHGAEMLLGELDRVSRELSVHPPQMLLRVGAPPFVAHSLMPQVLAALRGLSGDIRVELTEAGVPSLQRALLDGKLDALVTSFASDMSGAAGLKFERLYPTRVAVVAAVSNPLVGKRQISWATLAEQPWILPPRDSRVRRFLEDTFAQTGYVTPTPLIESSNPITNLRFVAAGLGIAAVPQECLRLVEAPEAIASLHLRRSLPEGTLALVYRTDGAHPRLKFFREALIQAGRHQAAI